MQVRWQADPALSSTIQGAPLPASLPQDPAQPPLAPPSRAGLGGGASQPAARRLDNRDKMALLPSELLSGLLGPDPGVLSPEQLEKLREFKVQARPHPPDLHHPRAAPLRPRPSPRQAGEEEREVAGEERRGVGETALRGRTWTPSGRAVRAKAGVGWESGNPLGSAADPR